jgi:NAD(P)-dependent dehydrogenase (short-subunit alcohol dehydrogenase family)
MELAGKVVVVTGSSGTIGRATAIAFARRGSRVVINSKSRPHLGEDLAAEIVRGGGSAVHVQRDVSTLSGAASLMHEVGERLGTIDILVNAAGATVGGGKFGELSEEDWLSAFQQNLFTAINAAQAVLPHMTGPDGGRIISISSVRGLEHCGRTAIMAYSAAKAAMINFTKTLAKELAPAVLVNAIAPGFVNSPNYDAMSDDLKRGFLEATLLGRFIDADEIAKGIVFLADSDSITGHVLVVDGGFSLKFQ